MEETPREYKKRVDEKWINNEKNKDKLIKKIDEYELLDKKYKTLTKQRILDNFSKNQKADKENDKYLTIASELGNIDEKYKALEELKNKLNQKKDEGESVKKEFIEIVVDGKDETTLNIQMAKKRSLKEKFDSLMKEIAEIEKDIVNREQEIQEIESIYGEKQNTTPDIKPAKNEVESSATTEVIQDNPSFQEYHRQSIKDLWKKDKILKEIIKLLDDGTGIDDELKESIKKEVSDRFDKYYDEKQGDIKVQIGRFLKNKRRDREKLEDIQRMPDGAEKDEKLKKFEKLEETYGDKTWKADMLKKLNLHPEHIVDIERCGKIGGTLVYKVKYKGGYYGVFWGERRCGRDFKEIGEIKDIGGKPCFKVRYDNGDYGVYRGSICVTCDAKKIWEIKDIGGKPCFKVKRRDGGYEVYRGDYSCGRNWSWVGNIHDRNGRPSFRVRRRYSREFSTRTY